MAIHSTKSHWLLLLHSGHPWPSDNLAKHLYHPSCIRRWWPQTTTAPSEVIAARSFPAQPATETIYYRILNTDRYCRLACHHNVMPFPSALHLSLPAKPLSACRNFEADLDRSILGLSLPLQHELAPANNSNLMNLKVTKILLAISSHSRCKTLVGNCAWLKSFESISSCSTYWNLPLTLRSVDLLTMSRGIEANKSFNDNMIAIYSYSVKHLRAAGNCL